MQQKSFSSKKSQLEKAPKLPDCHIEALLIWLLKDDKAKSKRLLLIPPKPKPPWILSPIPKKAVKQEDSRWWGVIIQRLL
jgi:hypothetical protein